MTKDFSKGDRRAIIAARLMWIPITVLVSGQLYLIIFGNWLSLYVSFYSLGVGAILTFAPIIFGVMALIGKTSFIRKVILAITLPILTIALSLLSFRLFSG